jgi:hypothetical protein
MRPVVQGVNEIKSQIRKSLDEDRQQQDSPAAYRQLYVRCRAGEWGDRNF